MIRQSERRAEEAGEGSEYVVGANYFLKSPEADDQRRNLLKPKYKNNKGSFSKFKIHLDFVPF